MSYRRIHGIPVWGTPLDNAVDQIVTCRETAEHAALMAGHHLGYSMPIGGVCAYAGQISPTGVGYDISCGRKAVRIDVDAKQVRRDIQSLMDEIWDTLSFGVGLKNKEQGDHPLFDNDEAWDVLIARSMKGLAREQLATIGSGNHYVDLFVDESDRVWIGAHLGSRGFGHRVATHFFQRAGKRKRDQPVLFDTDSETGCEYIACMKLAGRYAYAGRDWVCERVARILGARSSRRFTTIIISPGRKNTSVSLTGLFERVRRPPFPVKRGLSGVRWATFLSSSKGSTVRRVRRPSIPLCTEREG